jgi:hypothetical protein
LKRRPNRNVHASASLCATTSRTPIVSGALSLRTLATGASIYSQFPTFVGGAEQLSTCSGGAAPPLTRLCARCVKVAVSRCQGVKANRASAPLAAPCPVAPALLLCAGRTRSQRLRLLPSGSSGLRQKKFSEFAEMRARRGLGVGGRQRFGRAAAQRSDCRRTGASIWARQLISAIAQSRWAMHMIFHSCSMSVFERAVYGS